VFAPDTGLSAAVEYKTGEIFNVYVPEAFVIVAHEIYPFAQSFVLQSK
jgi:hypothetical protein